VYPVAAPVGLSLAHLLAEVAELADAHGSGPCTRKGVGVRVPSSAPSFNYFNIIFKAINFEGPQTLLESEGHPMMPDL
jgi:hypothetical protein